MLNLTHLTIKLHQTAVRRYKTLSKFSISVTYKLTYALVRTEITYKFVADLYET